ncbi:MAG: acyl-ACP--UDP-N-acetylglucosamine O-acyltransferase [gamma proteobacterium symbiont of Bathyaustriella thionipta]|nr:acyl-ACP--UDP-N-acetylglucosamine O-acyltransferase [gamma proteobacterium symbiont of Bathyaustriella thionipta]
MTLIHPTAIVNSKAELHETVEVGPYAIIDAHVEIGAHCFIDSHARVYSHTRMGQGNRVYHSAAVGGDPQDLKYRPDMPSHLIIGNHNLFREFCSIHRSTDASEATRIGDNNLFMGYTHVAHDCQLGTHNVLANGATLGGHIEMGDYILLSNNVGIHQFCRIGSYAMVAGLSAVKQDIPPYVLIDGHRGEIVTLNTIGLRRQQIPPEIRSEIKQAYKTIYRSGLTIRQALDKLSAEQHSDYISKIIDFFHNSERGVVSYAHANK